jgi:hypothetical protein
MQRWKWRSGETMIMPICFSLQFDFDTPGVLPTASKCSPLAFVCLDACSTITGTAMYAEALPAPPPLRIAAHSGGGGGGGTRAGLSLAAADQDGEARLINMQRKVRMRCSGGHFQSVVQQSMFCAHAPST